MRGEGGQKEYEGGVGEGGITYSSYFGKHR